MTKSTGKRAPYRLRHSTDHRFLLSLTVGNGCWLRGGSTSRGYAYFNVGNNRLVPAHRYAYELFVGPIPWWLDIDHTCHNTDQTCEGGQSCHHRRCCNPAHLEAVTHRENLRRGRRHAHHPKTPVMSLAVAAPPSSGRPYASSIARSTE